MQGKSLKQVATEMKQEIEARYAGETSQVTRILCVDPGGVRTGLALIEFTPTTIPILVGKWLVVGGPDGFLRWWRYKPAYDILVVEDYIVRQGVPSTHLALKTVGYLKGTEPDAIFQSPAGRKKVVSDDALKRLGLYETQRDIKEAVRHSIVYLKRQKHLPTLHQGWA